MLPSSQSLVESQPHSGVVFLGCVHLPATQRSVVQVTLSSHSESILQHAVPADVFVQVPASQASCVQGSPSSQSIAVAQQPPTG